MAKSRPPVIRSCAHCTSEFVAESHFRGVFCSYDCKAKAARKRLGFDEQIPKPVTAKKRRRRIVAAEKHPISVAFNQGDREALLAAIRSICIESDKGCWIPMPGYSIDNQACVVPTGYQSVYINGRLTPLHRLSCETHRGIVLGKMQCHHTCAVRACCNPEHLQPATMIDNVLEMRERTALRKRVADLERALKQSDPKHPLLWPGAWSGSVAHPLTLF